MADKIRKIYPHFTVANNKKPNRLYAFPLIGFIIKIIILLPVMFEMFFLSLYAFFVYLANWFVLSFTGKYWDYAYNLFLGMMRLSGKMQLFLFGVTDTYPGFGLDTKGLFELNFPKPEKPNPWLAIPLLGLVVRLVLLIPYFIFHEVLQRGSQVAMFLSWFAVTFKKKYPDSLYEFERDTLRVSFASSMYVLGLVDKYPSFSISMNHKNVKVALIIAGAILSVWNMGNSYRDERRDMNRDYKYNNERTMPQQMERTNSY
jgi:Domain of unknown function (DUF4389)